MLISGLVSIVLTSGEAVIGPIFLTAGLAFLITGIIRHRNYGDDPESDERSKKIGAYGLSYAWLIGLFFIVWAVLAGLSGHTQDGHAACARPFDCRTRSVCPDIPDVSLQERGCRLTFMELWGGPQCRPG